MPEDSAPKKFSLKPREFERLNAPRTEPSPTPPANDVFAIQREIRAREIAAGFDEVKPPAPRRSRRKRDYFLVMLGFNGFFGTALVLGRHNVVVALFAGSGMILASIAFTWVYWFIVEDY